MFIVEFSNDMGFTWIKATIPVSKEVAEFIFTQLVFDFKRTISV